MVKDYFKNIQGDISGGITAAIIALPVGLAFGIQSGLGAEAGLYTAIILCFLAALIGGTKTLISDPTGPMTVVSAAIIQTCIVAKGGALDSAIPLIVLTFTLAGIFQIAFGLIHVAQYVKYISYPVLSGFMGGIGIIIILFQWHAFLGENTPSGIINVISHLHEPFLHLHTNAVLIGVFTLVLIYGLPKISKKIPAGLVALVVSTIVSMFLEEGSVPTVGIIPTSLPSFKIEILEALNLADFQIAFVGAITLAGLGTIDTLLTSVVADNLTKTKHNGNKELIGQGLGNMVSALFGGIPGAGSTTGTVANINSLGKTSLSGIVKALTLLFILLALGDLVKYIPRPALSALLITVGIGVIDFNGMKRLIKLRNSESLILLLVIGITVFNDLLIAVGVGIVLSSFFFMQRMSELVERQSKEGIADELDRKLKLPEQMVNRVYEMDLSGPLFYGFSDQFKMQTERINDKDAVIINMLEVPYIDSSGVYVLEEAIKGFYQKDMIVVLVGVKENIFRDFERLKIIPNTIAEEAVYNTVKAGIKYLRYKLEEKNRKIEGK